LEELIYRIVDYAVDMKILEILGLVSGLMCVILLIRQNILTWPLGIFYVLVSLIIFWRERLYADFMLHMVYLLLNVYGWYHWVHGKQQQSEQLPVTMYSIRTNILLLLPTILVTLIAGWLFANYTDASVPYWDSTTTIFSFTGMWLTARKKLESWYYWFFVDVVATGVYIYKGIYFYALLYCIYIGLAVAGYINWKKSYHS